MTPPPTGAYLLVVDDDPDVRETMEIMLRLDGRTVVSARDGAQALQLLRSSGELPCVVFVDLMMPGMNGFEFLDALHDDPTLARVRVVVLTGAGAAVERRAREFSLDVLRKPMELAALLAV